MFLLTVTYAGRGHVSVLSFPTAFDRGLMMITLAAQPVTLRCAEYGS
jgi:hypothetical protein